MAKFRNKTILIIFSLFVVLAIINLIPGLNKGLGNFVYKIFSPAEHLFTKIGDKIIGFSQIIISIGDLNKENIALKQKNIILESEITQLKEMQQENSILKKTLSISENDQPIKEMASITGKDIQGIQDWILINKGSKQEIMKDMTAISPEGALVGKVSEINRSFAKITLITQKDSVVAGIIEDNRVEGLIKRDNSGGLFMDFIPKAEKLEIGDRIITSGMDNLYPKGILIGKIENIDSSENQIFQKINISLAADFSKLEQVIILK
jgi:rod shape-determining protein MreC